MKKNTKDISVLTDGGLTELLDKEQLDLVRRQHEKQTRTESVHYHYDLSGDGDFLDFDVDPGVWDPILASGRYHARYLFYNTHLFHQKDVIEIGCGCGLMGLAMAKLGAKHVFMGDITEQAIKNTGKNAQTLNIQNVSVYESDLFEDIPEIRVPLITWMIPFFPSEFAVDAYGGSEEYNIPFSMLMASETFDDFLESAKEYLLPDGVLLIPSFDLGGWRNDPRLVAPRFGYDVATKWSHRSTNGMQRGWLHMHELTLH